MNDGIAVDIIMEDGEQFTVYKGTNENEANQSEKFASLIVDKSEEPSFVIRRDKRDPSDNVVDIDGKMMVKAVNDINSMVINQVMAVLIDIDESITEDDIDTIEYIKNDPKINGRINFQFQSQEKRGDKIFINGLNDGIIESKAHSYAKVLLMDGYKIHIYFYYDCEGMLNACVGVDGCIEPIWEKMGELGHTNSEISYMTQSNPYAIEEYCGLSVEKEYIDKLIEMFGEDAVNAMKEVDEEDEDDNDDE